MTTMSILSSAIYFLLSLHLLNAASIYHSGSFVRNKGITQYQHTSGSTTPVEYLQIPNFNVMFLTEEKDDPMWKRYSDLFQPRDPKRTPKVEVNYGNQATMEVNGFQIPSIKMDRSEVESVLASLGGKKHIIVLHPRDCKPSSTMRMKVKNQTSLNEFENEFLPKLLQQLQKAPSRQKIGSDTLDPVIDRIIALLDKDEEKMLDDLRKSMEGYSQPNLQSNAMYSSGYTMLRGKPCRKEHKPQLSNVLLKDPCNQGYVFLVQNQKNSADPRSLNDLLMRVLKVVTESS